MRHLSLITVRASSSIGLRALLGTCKYTSVSIYRHRLLAVRAATRQAALASRGGRTDELWVVRKTDISDDTVDSMAASSSSERRQRTGQTPAGIALGETIRQTKTF